MKLKTVLCPICEKKGKYKILHPKNFSLKDFNKKIFSARRLPDNIHYRMVKCNQCGLVRSDPVIDVKNLNELYKEAKFEYENEVENLAETYLLAMNSILKKLPKNAKILEIGCGNGFVLKALMDLGFKNVSGLEPSMDALEKSAPKVKKKIILDVLKEDLFSKDSFDFIFFFQVFDHVPDPNKFLDLCHRILKKDGYILSFNHNIDSISSKILGERSPIIDIEHTFLYSPKTMRKIFKKNKFLIEKVYSPYNILSLKHFFWLFPLPSKIKNLVIQSKFAIIDKRIKIRLGNLCLISQK